MDSYDFSRETGRPVSPPLPEDYSMNYLPQMATYSGSTQSRNTRVSQPIDFGGSTSRYTGATQSRNTSVSRPIDFGGSTSRYTGASQSRHTSVPQIEYGSASQGTSTQSPRTYTLEERAAILADWHNSEETQGAYANRIGISQSTLSLWNTEAGGSSRSRLTERIAERQSKAVSDFRASGESQAGFSRRTGIPRGTLQQWIKKYEGSSRDAR